MNIIDAINDKRFFKSCFKDPSTWNSWLVCLKAIFALPMDFDELNIYRKFTGRQNPPKAHSKEAFIIVGRRGGKSFMSSIISVYIATFKDWSKIMGSGERGWVFIIANDKMQARIIKNYIGGILNSVPSFKNLISKDLAWEIELKNGVSIAVKTCNFRTVRGYTLLACIMEEVAFWRSEDSANPDKEMLAAVRPSLATIDDSLLLGISTPYAKRGLLYEQFKKYYGHEGGPLIWRASTESMNPTINLDAIQSAFDEDPHAASSEWSADFRKDITAFLPSEFIDAVVIPGRYELPKVEKTSYFGFADPSGGRQDSFTLGICHKDENGRIILDVLREKRPPFQPSGVVEEFAEVLKLYKIDQIESDRYAGEWVTEAFRLNGIDVINTDLTSSELYLNFLPLAANKTVELLDNKRLVNQLSGLERRTRSGGKDLVTHYPGAHDDLAIAMAGCVNMAAREGDDIGLIYYEGMKSPENEEMERLEEKQTGWTDGYIYYRDMPNLAPNKEDVEKIIAIEVRKKAEEIYSIYGYVRPHAIERSLDIAFNAAKNHLFQLGYIEKEKNHFIRKEDDT
jgi:hypothetical protein